MVNTLKVQETLEFYTNRLVHLIVVHRMVVRLMVGHLVVGASYGRCTVWWMHHVIGLSCGGSPEAGIVPNPAQQGCNSSSSMVPV